MLYLFDFEHVLVRKPHALFGTMLRRVIPDALQHEMLMR